MEREGKSKRKWFPSKRLAKSGTSGTEDVNTETTTRMAYCNHCTINTCTCVDIVKYDETSYSKNDNVEAKFERYVRYLLISCISNEIYKNQS